MKKFIIPVMAVELLFSVAVKAQGPLPPDYQSALARINLEYQSEKENCQALEGNAADMCIVEAESKQKIQKADLDAALKNTRKARYDARIVKAEADHSVAKEKCDYKGGNDKEACLKKAKALKEAAISDARAQLKNSSANRKVADESEPARKKAIDALARALADADKIPRQLPASEGKV